jgi:TetR/AcrR family transcriptional repressor of nem operon
MRDSSATNLSIRPKMHKRDALQVSCRGLLMRRSREEAAETRRSIVKTAGVRFRQNGICETGLADLMEGAGLTHGGFYRHFNSKDQLVSEASEDAFAAKIGKMEAAASTAKGRKALEAMVNDYLSAEHRKDRAHGCPLAALGSELARSEKSTGSTATKGILGMIDAVAERMGDPDTERANKSASVFLATMLGALTISRIVSDPKVSNEILAAARQIVFLGVTDFDRARRCA